MNIVNRLLYYLVILPISSLPFPVLYALSDFLYVIFYHVTGYRKKVILGNIQRSFPEKTEKEHIVICKKFYHHFCDLTLESLKTFTISEKQVAKRVIFKNPELIDKYYEQGRSVIIAGGHYNNWEIFAVAVDALIKHKAIGIYKPLSNKYFDEKMRNTRSKYGLYMISTRDVKKVFDEEINNLTATIFAIDQSPSNPDNCYWMEFLNQETGVLFGAEKYAREYNYPVVYGRINKEKRGHYSFEFFEVTDKPLETAYGEITEKATKMLEQDIRNQPEYWLWSHRRWKHKKPAGWNKETKAKELQNR
ncbi:MAG: Lipid biosynthesis acyltransferase [Bacteroidetes bacterium]|nr:Lipid biosynthesis acyltransferase [Bacteroidota bacterium]